MWPAMMPWPATLPPEAHLLKTNGVCLQKPATASPSFRSAKEPHFQAAASHVNAIRVVRLIVYVADTDQIPTAPGTPQTPA